jgi:hypothetical protein
MLNRWILIPAVCLAWLPALTQAAQVEDFKPSAPVATLMPLLIDNLDTLQLSPVQMQKVRGIARDNFAQVESINAQYHHLKTELREVTLDKQGNKTRSLKLIQELAELDAQRMALTIECVFGLKEILSLEQYEELIAIMEFTR